MSGSRWGCAARWALRASPKKSSNARRRRSTSWASSGGGSGPPLKPTLGRGLVAAGVGDPGRDEVADGVERRRGRGDGLTGALQALVEYVGVEPDEQLLFAVEVVVDRRLRHADRRRD